MTDLNNCETIHMNLSRHNDFCDDKRDTFKATIHTHYLIGKKLNVNRFFSSNNMHKHSNTHDTHSKNSDFLY